MKLQHIAAFSGGSDGGNPAGVVICDDLPTPEVMKKVAADVGYSETVFAAPVGERWRVRYFAPEVEVDFCGHATIALGAALARRDGSGLFALDLNRASITVEGRSSETEWSASFLSPPTHSDPVAASVLEQALALFNLTEADLDMRIPPAIANGGGDHLVLALNSRKALQDMSYDFETGKALAEQEGLVTFDLIHAETTRIFHARNPFPCGGVYEDPATGAAAAALAGYLRDIGWLREGEIGIRQGEDMGIPCRLEAEIPDERGAGVRVSGSARMIREPQILDF